MQSVKSRFRGQREFQKSNSPSPTSSPGSSRFPIWQLSYRRHIGKREDLGDEVAPSLAPSLLHPVSQPHSQVLGENPGNEVAPKLFGHSQHFSLSDWFKPPRLFLTTT